MSSEVLSPAGQSDVIVERLNRCRGVMVGCLARMRCRARHRYPQRQRGPSSSVLVRLDLVEKSARSVESRAFCLSRVSFLVIMLNHVWVERFPGPYEEGGRSAVKGVFSWKYFIVKVSLRLTSIIFAGSQVLWLSKEGMVVL